jgi:hypothetical protein
LTGASGQFQNLRAKLPQEHFMTGLSALWLPILLSSVLVFVASSIIHMFLPWHKNEYPKVPNEKETMDALRPLAIPPGDYMMPRCEGNQEMHSPEFTEKLKQGPVMVLTVLPNGPFSMGRNLTLWFIYCVVVGTFAAYVADERYPPELPIPTCSSSSAPPHSPATSLRSGR